MAVKRKPTAETISEGGVLVKHTHDIELAERLARTALAKEYGCPEDQVNLPQGRAIWTYITNCLPNSYGAGEGWGWQYHHASGPRRGAFPAVEFVLL